MVELWPNVSACEAELNRNIHSELPVFDLFNLGSDALPRRDVNQARRFLPTMGPHGLEVPLDSKGCETAVGGWVALELKDQEAFVLLQYLYAGYGSRHVGRFGKGLADYDFAATCSG